MKIVTQLETTINSLSTVIKDGDVTDGDVTDGDVTDGVVIADVILDSIATKMIGLDPIDNTMDFATPDTINEIVEQVQQHNSITSTSLDATSLDATKTLIVAMNGKIADVVGTVKSFENQMEESVQLSISTVDFLEDEVNYLSQSLENTDGVIDEIIESSQSIHLHSTIFQPPDQGEFMLTTGWYLISYPRNVRIADFISELGIDDAAVQFRIWDYRRGEEHPWVSYDQTEYSDKTGETRDLLLGLQEAKIPIIYRYRGYWLEIRGAIEPISVNF